MVSFQCHSLVRRIQPLKRLDISTNCVLLKIIPTPTPKHHKKKNTQRGENDYLEPKLTSFLGGLTFHFMAQIF